MSGTKSEGHVSVEKVVEYLHRNAANAKKVVLSLLNGGLDLAHDV